MKIFDSVASTKAVIYSITPPRLHLRYSAACTSARPHEGTVNQFFL